MKNKLFKKSLLTIGLVLVTSLCLVSCAPSTNETSSSDEYIQVYAFNDIDIREWHSFSTTIKVKTKASLKQEIEVICFTGATLNQSFEHQNAYYDESQNLQFTLKRYVYNSIFNKSLQEEVYSFTNTLKYFFSDDFVLHYYDTITAKDLIRFYNDYGVISYSYEITPIDDEKVKVYEYKNPADHDEGSYEIYGASIVCYLNPKILYRIKWNQKIVFTKPEKGCTEYGCNI